MLAAKLLSAAGGEDKLYVDDVFSAYTYTGNGSTQTITNGIALADGLTLAHGSALEGGYYCGIVVDNGLSYALIVSPKSGQSTQEFGRSAYATSLLSVTDGATNTTNLFNSVGIFPAADYCESYVAGGKTDWYLPAKNELLQAAINLAPSVTGIPLIFQTGGAEAFSAVSGTASYWSSSNLATNSTSAYTVDFFTKVISSSSGDVGWYTRPFRRVLLTDAALAPYYMAGEGGMVWIKQRQASYVHLLTDSTMARGQRLNSAVVDQMQNNAPYNVTAFNSNGFSLNDDAAGSYGVNGGPGGTYAGTNAAYVSWTFRKAPKFFDVVTYTGDGVASRQIAHELGCEVGMVLTKATSTTGDWNTYHRSATGDLVLNTAAAQTGSKSIISAASTTTFTVNGVANTNGVTYVAHIFAHDTSTD